MAALSASARTASSASAQRHLHGWHTRVRHALGPTASARTVLDVVALPLVTHLGYDAMLLSRAGIALHAVLRVAGQEVAVLLVTAWGEDPSGLWRDAVKRGIGHGVRWCLCVNGPALRLFDARRAYSRRFAEFDLALALDDELTASIFWTLLAAHGMARPDGAPALDRAVELCERHRTAVRNSLKAGVHEALVTLGGAFLARGRERAKGRALDESLTVIYRVLFLLFAEARGLVPQWHPIYKNSYTVESLRLIVEGGPAPRGLWQALQAIARLAHRGCRAGTLRVPPFNGRLFSPADAPLADSVLLDDAAVSRALLALTTRQTKDRRERIAYADLGVEQLGGVYEHVLDYVADGSASTGLQLRHSGFRKATGTFYTPRSLTEYLVRRTLAPLVDEARPDAVLALRVLDPAMGSGAFLVAACRYLAQAYERALVREDGLRPSDISDTDRTSFRRLVAQRCLFGVDINPMAVQLSRLSLWLATLAADRPLTFLDHHFRCGDSLVGASPVDIHRQPTGGRGRRARPGTLPLFAMENLESELHAVVTPRLGLARDSDDTLEQVKQKERTLASLSGPHAPLARWRDAADLWCAGWFMRSGSGRVLNELLRQALGAPATLPAHVSQPLREAARAEAASRKCFHWTLEFPEVFFDESGQPLSTPGFDAILGNPPWEMLRADRGPTRGIPATRSSELWSFVRGSGIYSLQGGHSNLYQLFMERALSLLRRDGRLGFIVPANLGSDHGCAALRRELLDKNQVDTFTTCENRERIFPIHRSVKFTLLTLAKGGNTPVLPLRTGIRAATTLDQLPDTGGDVEAVPVPRSLLTRLSGNLAAIPEIRSARDLELVARISLAHRALGDPHGWDVAFGRELNATDDSRYFRSDRSGLPVLEGKHLSPFRVDVTSSRFTLPLDAAARLLPHRPFARPRLAYRDVASSTNRLTLIAAIVPAGVVTTHTVFCLRGEHDPDLQYFLCGIFNSFIANYLVRMRVTTHVTAALIEHLPVPQPSRNDPAFVELATLSRTLSDEHRAHVCARHQALAAQLYGVDARDFSHILEGFPLVSRGEREEALEMFRCIVGRGGT
jgi:hypothetical protein